MVGNTAKFSPNESFKEKWHFKQKDYNTPYHFHFTWACKIVWKVQLCISAASYVWNYAVSIYLSEAVVVSFLWANKEKLQALTVVKKSFRRRYCIALAVNTAIIAISTTIVDLSELNPA